MIISMIFITKDGERRYIQSFLIVVDFLTNFDRMWRTKLYVKTKLQVSKEMFPQGCTTAKGLYVMTLPKPK
jgi:hypothetical protein